MVRKVFYRQREDGVNLYRTYSDSGMIIRQVETGNEYEEAIDIENAYFTYEETNIDITGDELTDEEALAILLGGD